MVAQKSDGGGLWSSGQVYAAASTTTLGCWGEAAFAAYVGRGVGTDLVADGLADWAGVVGWALRSFLTLVVALARLASMFSRLVRRIWRALSSLAGAVLAGVP